MSTGLRFRHHFIDTDLPAPNGVGNYGHTALVDIDGDGRLDFVLGRNRNPGILYWYENRGTEPWVRHVLGHDSMSDVGAAALDVDGDGRPDLVCSGTWFRNPGNPREQEFERYVFDPDGGGAHDIAVADVDGDGRPDILRLREGPEGICWYRIPEDPTGPWERHVVGPGVHGAITPAGFGDIDGDGDLDIVCADMWYENVDGKGTVWAAHRNIPFGRVGPYGMCVRCAVVDIDGDGRQELVMVDTDIVGSRAAILRNVDGKGGRWERQDLPQSFTYGSIHSLAVADFSGNGRLDILVNEQEELLPPDRRNPRWVIWENLGGGEWAERIILDCALGGHELQVGDVNGDGRLDICSKVWSPASWNANGGRAHVDWLENVSGL